MKPRDCHRHALMTIAEMRATDQAAIDGGVPGPRLMEHAGRAIAEAIEASFPGTPVLVLAGPGNNGGDGFVVARRLRRAGWPVRVGLLGEQKRLRGDAAEAASRYDGAIEPAHPDLLEGAGLVVDALFGAGLDRRLEGVALALVEALRKVTTPIVAVDIPSGVHGDTGEMMGSAAPAQLTVTFHRAKPGHLLLPGRSLCGRLAVVDIGIPATARSAARPEQYANHPALWVDAIELRSVDSHKYAHGHALVLGGGPTSSGAGRLAARAALRTGAGLVTILAPSSAGDVHANTSTAVMVRCFEDVPAFGAALSDPRQLALLLGPGAGRGAELRALVGLALESGKPCVLDADALTSYEEGPDELFALLRPDCLLTPHEGEFRRLFGAREGSKLKRAREAATRSGAVVLLKGADTVIASPDGRAIIQPSAPPSLATAGSGDVLAGIATGLMARGLSAFEAGAAATWIHASAGSKGGEGMIAEDLVEAVPEALTSVCRRYRRETAQGYSG